MRRVKFKKWIPKHYLGGENPYIDPNTNKWEDDFIHNGVFHQWGVAYEEFENGAANYTVALVELLDGTIVEVLPSNIKFLE